MQVPCQDFMRWTYKTLCKSWVAWCNSSLVVCAQVMVFAIAEAPKFKSYFWKPKISLTLYGWPWLGLRNLERPCWKAAELLQLQLSFSAELDFSWVELLQLQLSFSAELNFSWVELSQLQLNFNFSCGPLWPYTSWTCLRAVELGFSLLRSPVRTSWTGPEGQFNSSLTPLTSDLQSAVRLADRSPEMLGGSSTGLISLVSLQVFLPVSLPVRLVDSLPDLQGAVQPP
jgi:hypothetical protein